MPEIKAFKAYRYNSDVVGRYDKVLTPPYDVISPKQRDAFYKKSPYNFVRIDLRKTSGGRDAYSSASKQLNDWIRKKVFVSEEKPSVYVYVQDYKSLSNKKTTRYGFFSLMKINEKKVKKHENTLSGPKKDRMRLMKKTRAQMSPIMGLFQDKSGSAHKALVRISKRKPIIDIKTDDVRHRLYIENDPEILKSIQKAVKPSNMYIADGHHRFEVANQFKKTSKIKGSEYIFTYLCDADRNDFTIYPTHRMLQGLDDAWRHDFADIVAKYFEVTEHKTLADLEKALELPSKKVSVGAFVDGKYLQLTLKKTTKDLDTTVLDQYLIRPLLGEDVAGSDRYFYTRDSNEVVALVKKKKADAGFFLSKMPIQEMIRVSDKGVKLPQKSTYFYPKLLSGMLFYKF